MITPNKRVRMAGNVDSSDISEAIKHFQIPSNLTVEGVEVPISLVQLVDGTKRPIPFVSGSAPWGNGIPRMVRDATANNSDKTLTVPAGKIWSVQYVHAEIAATATVGNRQLVGIITDGTNPIYSTPRTGNIAAGQTGVLKLLAGGALFTTSTSLVPLLSGAAPNICSGASLQNPIILLAGYTLRVLDAAAIDPAADDLTMIVQYTEYDA